MFRWLLGLLVVVALAVAGAYVVAGRGAPPLLTIDRPDRVIGQSGTLEVTAAAPNAKLTALTITLEQNGRSYSLYSLDGAQTATVARVSPDVMRVSRPLGKQTVPELQSGKARIVVTATRPALQIGRAHV